MQCQKRDKQRMVDSRGGRSVQIRGMGRKMPTPPVATQRKGDKNTHVRPPFVETSKQSHSDRKDRLQDRIDLGIRRRDSDLLVLVGMLQRSDDQYGGRTGVSSQRHRRQDIQLKTAHQARTHLIQPVRGVGTAVSWADAIPFGWPGITIPFGIVVGVFRTATPCPGWAW